MAARRAESSAAINEADVETVRQLLRGGVREYGEIVRETGLSYARVSMALVVLCSQKEVLSRPFARGTAWGLITR